MLNCRIGDSDSAVVAVRVVVGLLSVSWHWKVDVFLRQRVGMPYAAFVAIAAVFIVPLVIFANSCNVFVGGWSNHFSHLLSI